MELNQFEPKFNSKMFPTESIPKKDKENLTKLANNLRQRQTEVMDGCLKEQTSTDFTRCQNRYHLASKALLDRLELHMLFHANSHINCISAGMKESYCTQEYVRQIEGVLRNAIKEF